jgi:7-cyano-7-deazaguanine synthase in queuosine biosynthesis
MAYQICKKCILDSNIPNITFDKDGVCNFCNEYIKRESPPTKEYYASREKEFIRLTKSSSKKYLYDCICLYSGGKDSSYMLYNLVNKYKLKVLAFTLDHGFLAKEAFLNIKKTQSKLNFDSIIFRPSTNLKTTFFKIGIFEYARLPVTKELAYTIGNVCWPCFVLIAMSAIKFAVEKQIPNLIVGTTPGQIRQKKYDLISKYSDLTDVYKTMVIPMIKLLKITGNEQLIHELDLPFLKKLKVLKVKLLPFYEYVEYNEESVISTVRKELGWERPLETDSCSSNCLLNSLGIELHRKRYRISPYAIPFSRDIREGLIDREEALKAINAELNKTVVKNVAQELGIDLEVIN